MAVTVPWLMKPFAVVEQCFWSEIEADGVQCSKPEPFGMRKASENGQSASFNNALNQQEKYRVNQIGEVHCQRRKRRAERENGGKLAPAGSNAKSEKSFVSGAFSGDARAAEKSPDGRNWRREGNWGRTFSGP